MQHGKNIIPLNLVCIRYVSETGCDMLVVEVQFAKSVGQRGGFYMNENEEMLKSKDDTDVASEKQK